MIKQKLQEQKLQALKSGEKDKLAALSYILAQIQNAEIEKKKELTDDEVGPILKKIAKELRESIEAFEKGGRSDLVAESKMQLEMVLPLLPAELSDDDLKKEIDRVISENQEVYKTNPKAIIGIAIRELKTKAEPQRIMKALIEKK